MVVGGGGGFPLVFFFSRPDRFAGDRIAVCREGLVGGQFHGGQSTKIGMGWDAGGMGWAGLGRK